MTTHGGHFRKSSALRAPLGTFGSSLESPAPHYKLPEILDARDLSFYVSSTSDLAFISSSPLF